MHTKHTQKKNKMEKYCKPHSLITQLNFFKTMYAHDIKEF